MSEPRTPTVGDWLLRGDYAALQAHLETLDARLHQLERGQVGQQTSAVAVCLSVLAERFTVVEHFSEGNSAVERDFAAKQLRYVARSLCRHYQLDVPAWARVESPT